MVPSQYRKVKVKSHLKSTQRRAYQEQCRSMDKIMCLSKMSTPNDSTGRWDALVYSFRLDAVSRMAAEYHIVMPVMSPVVIQSAPTNSR